MNYRSIADMNNTILSNFHRLPRDIDIVVGIPRSGLIAANLISLFANIPMTDLDRLLEGQLITSGTTKKWSGLEVGIENARKILIVDDSVDSGSAMAAARSRIAESGLDCGDKLVFAAIYGLANSQDTVDFVFETVPQPRIFQWNMYHHKILRDACVDIDGVLCLDPTASQNDDGSEYEKFLNSATPLLRLNQKIGYLVTSRLEKYRQHTEQWLRSEGIDYGELVMLDLPTAAERRRLNAHGAHKASFYKKVASPLFIESEASQAQLIAELSGKPVFCVESQVMIHPDKNSVNYIAQSAKSILTRLKTHQRANGYFGLCKVIYKKIIG